MSMKQTDSHIVWNGRSWQLHVHTVEFSDGSTMERGAIRHPGAVVLVPILSMGADPELLMLRQYRHVLDETIIELPAGTRGWNEDWLLCAQRELREETGYRANTFTKLGQIWPTPGLSDELMMLYLATELTPDPLPVDADEQIEIQSFRLSELLQMVDNGRIQDAKTMIGIWKTAVSLNFSL